MVPTLSPLAAQQVVLIMTTCSPPVTTKWKSRFVMMPTLSPLVASKDVVITTCGANSNDKVGIITTLDFQCILTKMSPKMTATPRTNLTIWRRHGVEEHSALLNPLCGKSTQSPTAPFAINVGFWYFYDLSLNRLFNKHPSYRWMNTHVKVIVILLYIAFSADTRKPCVGQENLPNRQPQTSLWSI